MQKVLLLTLRHDQDVVTARQRAAQIAALVGFETAEQTRIATAVSEIVRNAFRYASGGEVRFGIELDARPQTFVAAVQDQGPGIPHLDDVLAGRYRSDTGMGIGMAGARRLMDSFEVESSPAGTTVVLRKALPGQAGVLTEQRTREILDAVTRRAPHTLLEEVQQQNRQLLGALDELQRKQQELVHLNRELEDTNRGVVALYAELDEKADHLRRADELKSRFLSNMTHEFRTPVNSIIGLCNLLVEDCHTEGREIEPEILYIRKAADQLSELVNDLLDLAKVEAGKTEVRPAAVEIAKLFGALRGMLRPMLLNQSVALVFDDADGLPPMRTDEAKVSQILRNLVSNALKFTERGEVRVSASVQGDRVTFTVADTGIGIAREDQERIFEEFTQVEHRLQRKTRGTGLGLPLSRRLAELLGGVLSVQSEPGIGSTFMVVLPLEYAAPPKRALVPAGWKPGPGKLTILAIEDAADAQYFYEKVFRNSPFQIYPALSEAEADAALESMLPAAIILDLRLGDAECWDLLVRLKRDDATRTIPLVVVSALDARDKSLALGADAFLSKPVDRRVLVDAITALCGRIAPPLKALVIDDEEVSRFLIRSCLCDPGFEVIEAATAEEGLRRVHADRPDVVLLDLVLPDQHGREVLARLGDDPATSGLPVVIVTSTRLEPDERRALLARAHAVLAKAELSRETLRDAIRSAVRPQADTYTI